MVTAALVSFAILLVAWIAAPDRPPRPELLEDGAPVTEARPLAA